MTNALLQLDADKACSAIEEFIRNEVQALERNGVILGLSGGVDSTVLAYLAARAVGPKNVLCVMLPDKHSSPVHLRHAKQVVEHLGTRYKVENLTPRLNKFPTYRMVPRRVPGLVVKRIFGNYMQKIGESSFGAGLLGTKDRLVSKANAFYRVKHRMRGVILFYHADVENLLLAGGANRTEFLIGLFIKFGCDSATDVMPIGNLYKTQVRQIAEHLGVPHEIIDKPPSADLMPGITDEFVMGASYETLDAVLAGLDRGLSRGEIVEAVRCEPEFIVTVQQWMLKSRHKREAPIFLPMEAVLAG